MLESRFDELDSRFDKIDSRFDKIEITLEKHDRRFDEINYTVKMIYSQTVRLSLDQAKLSMKIGSIENYKAQKEDKNINKI